MYSHTLIHLKIYSYEFLCLLPLLIIELTAMYEVFCIPFLSYMNTTTMTEVGVGGQSSFLKTLCGGHLY